MRVREFCERSGTTVPRWLLARSNRLLARKSWAFVARPMRACLHATRRQVKKESAHFLIFVCRCWMKLAPGCLSAPFNISCFISCMLACVTCENDTKLCKNKKNVWRSWLTKNNPAFPSLCDCDWCYTDDKEIKQFSTECQKVLQVCIGFRFLHSEKNKNQTGLGLEFSALKTLASCFFFFFFF